MLGGRELLVTANKEYIIIMEIIKLMNNFCCILDTHLNSFFKELSDLIGGA